MTNDKYQGERVLVVPTPLFRELGHFQGFSSETEPYLRVLLDGEHTRFMLRRDAEEDPGFKQLIPYCVLRHRGRVLHYRRGEGGGEGRLLGRRSIGVGGHISAEDGDGHGHPYQIGLQREIDEEVEIRCEYRQQMVGLINDDESSVGQVHLGVVHVMELESPAVALREDELHGEEFAEPRELLRMEEEFETWSRICLRYLVENA